MSFILEGSVVYRQGTVQVTGSTITLTGGDFVLGGVKRLSVFLCGGQIGLIDTFTATGATLFRPLGTNQAAGSSYDILIAPSDSAELAAWVRTLLNTYPEAGDIMTVDGGTFADNVLFAAGKTVTLGKDGAGSEAVRYSQALTMVGARVPREGETIATLEASPAAGTTRAVAFVNDGYRSGFFEWKAGNFSTHVAADTLKGVYVASSIVAATMGCWVREGAFARGVSVEWFGAKGDATTDCTAAVHGTVAFVDWLGGGVINFGGGVFVTSSGLFLGNGTDTTPSTKDNRIKFVGLGAGATSSVTNQQVIAATTIRYTGSNNDTIGVINYQGPMYGCGIRGISLDCDMKCGRAINGVHIYQSQFYEVVARNYRTIGYLLTTRSGYMVGCAYGCAENLFFGCFGYLDIAPPGDCVGVFMTSGVSSGTSLDGQPDSCRNTFIGGTYMYGQTAGSHGFLLSGADNNSFMQPLCYPFNGSTLGYDVWLQQWPTGGLFPLENAFFNIGGFRGVSGNGGIGSGWGNTFFPLPTADGAPLPTTTGVSGATHLGQTFVAGERAWRGRKVAMAESATSQSTTSATLVAVPGYSVTMATRASTQLKISFSGMATKSTAGVGYFALFINGTYYPATLQPVGATGFYAGVSINYLASVGAGTNTVQIRFNTSDANSTIINSGTLVVQELY